MNVRRAFTLIELLLVIAIIALLIALLLPALSKARELSMSVQCQGALRSIGHAAQLYLNDHDGQYPDKIQGDPPAGTQTSWLGKAGNWSPTYQLLTPNERPLNYYLGVHAENAMEVPACLCPADKGWLNNDPVLSYDRVGSSYWQNQQGVGSRTFVNNLDGNTGIRTEEVPSPSRMVVIGEPGVFLHAWSLGTPPATLMWHNPVEFRWNLLFADGHVSFTEVLPFSPSATDYTFFMDE